MTNTIKEQAARELAERLGSTEIIEQGTGVGLFIVTPDDFFCAIQEKSTKPTTNKLRGMFSAPFETVEKGESHEDTWKRALEEEVVFNGTKPPIGQKLCQIQLFPGIWLHAYLATIGGHINIEDGTFTEEVSDACWLPISEVKNSTTRRFRPGMREIIESYKAFLSETENFRPRIYFVCKDKISKEEFAQAEAQER